MAQRIQPPENKTENQTTHGTIVLYETTLIRRNNGNYRNCNAVYTGWGCNIFACSAAFGDIFAVDTGKDYDILGREKNICIRQISL